MAQIADECDRQPGYGVDPAPTGSAALGDIRALCLEILDEAVAVGRTGGAHLAADEAQRTMAMLLTYAPELRTSRYFDRLAGHPLEIEALTGAVVAAGKRHDIATPLNEALLALLRAASDAASGVPG
jgi:2-dehydropantoate 2-reductase